MPFGPIQRPIKQLGLQETSILFLMKVRPFCSWWPRGLTDILCSLLPVCPVRRLQVWQGHSCVWWISECMCHQQRTAPAKDGRCIRTDSYLWEWLPKWRKINWFQTKRTSRGLLITLGTDCNDLVDSYPFHRGRRSTNRPDRHTVSKIGADSALCVQIFCSCTHFLEVTRPPGSMALERE